jgi:hypothetical protein
MKVLWSFFLVLCLSACQSPFVADLVTPPGQPLYHEDFSNPSSGWPHAVSADGELGYADGAYRILVQSAGHDLWAVSGHAYGDVKVEADAARLAGPVINRFGVICRYQDGKNFYFFIISSDGYYAIGKIKNGAAVLLGQSMMAYNSAIIQGDGTNHLRFDCLGNTLTAYANGQPVAITSDADFSAGDAGLIAGTFDQGGVEIVFDNFVVYKP